MPSSITSKSSLPAAVTMGDPAGIGPSVVANAWSGRTQRGITPFVYIGAPRAIAVHHPGLPVQEVSGSGEASSVFSHALPVLPVPLKANVTAGVPDRRNTGAVIQSLDLAVKEVLAGNVSAIVTSPVHKSSLLAAGFSHPGHTGYLGARTKATPVMMLANDRLKVVPITGHVPLKDVPKILTKKKIIETVQIAAKDLASRFGIVNPRMAITGLNPHAGEDGALGSEEIKTIIPAIKALEEMGYQVAGPYPADTAFTPAMRMKFDVFFAMTHDQALIPIKTLDYRKAVNITLGLPLVRTSPAHGTAFDLIREGRTPDPESFIQALLWAERLAGK